MREGCNSSPMHSIVLSSGCSLLPFANFAIFAVKSYSYLVALIRVHPCKSVANDLVLIVLSIRGDAIIFGRSVVGSRCDPEFPLSAPSGRCFQPPMVRLGSGGLCPRVPRAVS